MPSLVSVLIPAHNAERWLADTLHCVLAQTWPRLEIIVADDGSTDRTLSVARAVGSSTVRVLALPHRGAAAARNAAMDAASGSHFQFIDADDIIVPGKIAAQMAVLEGRPFRLATGAWAPFMLRPGEQLSRPDALWQDLAPVQWMLNKFGQNAYMFPATWLASRQLVERAGRWNEALSLDDDGEFMARLVASSEDVSFVEEAYSYHRVGNSGSLSSQTSLRALQSLSLSMQSCIAVLLALEDSERTRAACLRYLQDNVAHFMPDAPDLHARCHALARYLGGELAEPRQSPQFALLRALLGWSRAKRLRSRWNNVRWDVRRAWAQLHTP